MNAYFIRFLRKQKRLINASKSQGKPQANTPGKTAGKHALKKISTKYAFFQKKL